MINDTKMEEKVAEVAQEPEIVDYKAEFEKLKKSYTGLKAMYAKEKNIWTKTPILTKMFKEAGGNEAAVSDFLKLNSNLFKIDDEKELKEAFEQSKKSQSYMFKAKETKEFNAAPFENSSIKLSQKEADSAKAEALFKSVFKH